MRRSLANATVRPSGLHAGCSVAVAVAREAAEVRAVAADHVQVGDPAGVAAEDEPPPVGRPGGAEHLLDRQVDPHGRGVSPPHVEQVEHVAAAPLRRVRERRAVG
jgi:hypothetical protein